MNRAGYSQPIYNGGVRICYGSAGYKLIELPIPLRLQTQRALMRCVCMYFAYSVPLDMHSQFWIRTRRGIRTEGQG